MNPPGTTGAPFQALATNIVSSSNLVSCLWPGLTNGITYEWYAVVKDDAGNTATTAIWRFKPLNVAPVAANQSRTIIGDDATNLLLTVTDANGDPLTFLTNSFPLHGLLQSFNSSAGSVTYVPIRGYRGSDRFTFSGTDGLLTSSNCFDESQRYRTSRHQREWLTRRVGSNLQHHKSER
ncbi:MAG: Ig-like domain-containing protein [Limisphaerales bacterium]